MKLNNVHDFPTTLQQKKENEVELFFMLNINELFNKFNLLA